MATETRTCENDGWVLTRTTQLNGDSSANADARKKWAPMCDECKRFIKGHLGIIHNSGSKQPPEPGANAHGKKGKGRKYANHDSKTKEKDI